MKKFCLGIFISFLTIVNSICYAENAFTNALKTCSPYSQNGGATYEKSYINILITVQKNKNKCVYKEKIYKGTDFQLLTCNFDMEVLPDIADNMSAFTTAYKKEVDKNRIFEAKLTNNGYVFEKYLINPKYCNITSSSTK